MSRKSGYGRECWAVIGLLINEVRTIEFSASFGFRNHKPHFRTLSCYWLSYPITRARVYPCLRFRSTIVTDLRGVAHPLFLAPRSFVVLHPAILRPNNRTANATASYFVESWICGSGWAVTHHAWPSIRRSNNNADAVVPATNFLWVQYSVSKCTVQLMSQHWVPYLDHRPISRQHCLASQATSRCGIATTAPRYWPWSICMVTSRIKCLFLFYVYP